MKRYRVNEIFYSLQGEGIRAGTANIFVRFSGCNQTCKKETHGFDCDTEFVSGVNMEPADILSFCQKVPQNKCRWIIFTGGEPALQVDEELVDYFHAAGYKLAIETNGSVELPKIHREGQQGSEECSLDCYSLDWITVSPKVAEHCIRQRFAHEVKYVRGIGQSVPKTCVTAEHYLISPAFDGMELDGECLQHCTMLCKDNPLWRLSVQQHKGWRVR